MSVICTKLVTVGDARLGSRINLFGKVVNYLCFDEEQTILGDPLFTRPNYNDSEDDQNTALSMSFSD